MVAGDWEGWLAEWLVQPSLALRELPINAAARPGVLELVEQQLLQTTAFNGRPNQLSGFGGL
jgi:hypothetical protein